MLLHPQLRREGRILPTYHHHHTTSHQNTLKCCGEKRTHSWYTIAADWHRNPTKRRKKSRCCGGCCRHSETNLATCTTKIRTLCSTHCPRQKRRRGWTSTHACTAGRTCPGCRSCRDLLPHRTSIYSTCGGPRNARRVTRHREPRDDAPTRTDDHPFLTTATQIAH